MKGLWVFLEPAEAYAFWRCSLKVWHLLLYKKNLLETIASRYISIERKMTSAIESKIDVFKEFHANCVPFNTKILHHKAKYRILMSRGFYFLLTIKNSDSEILCSRLLLTYLKFNWKNGNVLNRILLFLQFWFCFKFNSVCYLLI